MDQSVKVQLDQRVTKNVKIGRGTRMLFVTSFIQLSDYITQEALEGLGDFKVGG
jgi:hypothetical protein